MKLQTTHSVTRPEVAPEFFAARRYLGEWVYRLPGGEVVHRVANRTAEGVHTVCGRWIPAERTRVADPDQGMDGCQRCVRGTALR